MKHALLILTVGIMLAIASFASTYVFSTAHSLERNPKPELAWLKQEYQLSDEQYGRVCELYAAYHPQCMEMCREIDAQNTRLKTLLANTNVVTVEIRQALADVSTLRAKCQANMLNHFYQVSQVMPPEQGQRYLAWVQKETLIPSPMATGQGKTQQPAIP